jgi:membrane-associated PAP2 superfamily phosphatase
MPGNHQIARPIGILLTCGVGAAVAAEIAIRVSELPGATYPAPHDLWITWNLDPVLLAGLVLAAAAYRRDWARHRRERETFRASCFTGGLVVVAIALVSPLDALSGHSRPPTWSSTCCCCSLPRRCSPSARRPARSYGAVQLSCAGPAPGGADACI